MAVGLPNGAATSPTSTVIATATPIARPTPPFVPRTVPRPVGRRRAALLAVPLEIGRQGRP